MKAIVLSAGQGRRLKPLTARDPKCVLPVAGERTLLEYQLRTLARCGVERATVVVGFGAQRVERVLAAHPIPGMRVETLYNPFYAMADNLVTCWLASVAMTEDFVLLNGDTLFEGRVLRRLLDAEPAPVTVTVDRKLEYDADDMKVSLDDAGRLVAIGKKLPPEQVDGESIGLLAFRGAGVAAFREALDGAIRHPEALRAWYLTVVHEMAQRTPVHTASIRGLWWREIDVPEDLAEVRESLRREAAEPARVASRAATLESA